MKPVVKGVIIGCSVVLFISIIVVTALVWFVGSKKDELMAQGTAIRAEGNGFGKGVSEPKCVDEAVARYGNNRGVVGVIRNSVWLGGCLEISAFDAGFCAGVPSGDEFARTVTWRVEQCRNRGFAGDSNCPNLFAEVQRYCDGAARAKKKQ